MTARSWAALAFAFVALVAGFVASTPSPTPAQGFIGALNAIDLDIVHGDPELAVARGFEVCAALSRGEPAGVERFTSPAHPGGFGTEAGRLILAAVRQHLCPEAML